MALKLYYQPHSTADLTLAVLAELEHGQSQPIVERARIDLRKGESRTPEYLKNINPNGLVPALVHDGTSIWESAAITIHLGELYGVEREPKLFPPAGRCRGEAMKWIVWTSTHISNHGRALGEALGSKSEAALDKAMKGLEEQIKILEDALEGKKYLLGDAYCLADTHVWAAFPWLAAMGLKLEEFPNVVAWKERVGQRPALKSL